MTTKVLPEVEFIRAWQHYTVGRRIRPDSAMFRNRLLQWGYVKLVEPEPVAQPEPEQLVQLEVPKKKKHRNGSHSQNSTGVGTAVDG